MTCGHISTFLREFLPRLGWRVRAVLCMRLEGAYDTYDNGHSLIEFYWPKFRKWVLADVDLHHMFVKGGTYLNLAEVSELVHTGRDFGLEPLTLPAVGAVDPSDAVTGDFAAYTYAEPMFADERVLKTWYRRCFAVPFVGGDDDGWYFHCDNERDRQRILRYSSSYKLLDKRDWLKRFYA